MFDGKFERKLARSAEEVKRYRLWMKILPVILASLVLVSLLIYVISILYDRYGSFTVSIDKFDTVKYALAISETQDFTYYSSRLNAKANTAITNISKDRLPTNLDSNEGGDHSGKNFMAYTFFVKNTGSETVTYEYQLNVVNCVNNMDEAIRIRLYVDGVSTDYAKTRSGIKGIFGPEEGTTEFLTAKLVMRDRTENFAYGDMTRFTVVVWVEGSDDDCTDELRGGQFKLSMDISIITEEVES